MLCVFQLEIEALYVDGITPTFSTIIHCVYHSSTVAVPNSSFMIILTHLKNIQQADEVACSDRHVATSYGSHIRNAKNFNYNSRKAMAQIVGL